MFSLEEQSELIAMGKQRLIESGVNEVNAFRAGSFGFNVETLSALHKNNIFIDSRYSACCMGLESNLMSGNIDGITEFTKCQ